MDDVGAAKLLAQGLVGRRDVEDECAHSLGSIRRGKETRRGEIGDDESHAFFREPLDGRPRVLALVELRIDGLEALAGVFAVVLLSVAPISTPASYRRPREDQEFTKSRACAARAARRP